MSSKHASLFTREHVLGMNRDNGMASWHVKNDNQTEKCSLNWQVDLINEYVGILQNSIGKTGKI